MTGTYEGRAACIFDGIKKGIKAAEVGVAWKTRLAFMRHVGARRSSMYWVWKEFRLTGSPTQSVCSLCMVRKRVGVVSLCMVKSRDSE